MSIGPYINALAAISALTAAVISPANAATQLARDTPIDQSTALYQVMPGLTTPKVKLAAGQPVYVYAKGTTTSNTASGIMMFGMQVACGTSTADKASIADSYQTTRNHEGTLAYPKTPGKLELQVRYLFVPPLAGDYECSLMAKNLFGKGEKPQILTLLSGSSTYITDLSIAPGAKVWGIENDKSDFDLAGKPDPSPNHECVRDNVALDPKINGVANTTTYCKGSVHIGPGLPAGESVYSLRSDDWSPRVGATSIKAIGDIELTSCFNGTGSCPPYAWGTDAQRSGGSWVKSHLVVQQFPEGSDKACGATFNSPSQMTEITSNAHHLKVYHDIARIDLASNSAACGANSHFVSKIYVAWVSGNPIRIEDSRYSQNILMSN
jgi:hypothetical protein